MKIKTGLNPKSVRLTDTDTEMKMQSVISNSNNPDLTKALINYINGNIDNEMVVDIVLNAITMNIHNGVKNAKLDGDVIPNNIIEDNINMIKQVLYKGIRNRRINTIHINMILIPVNNILNAEKYSESVPYQNIMKIVFDIKKVITSLK